MHIYIEFFKRFLGLLVGRAPASGVLEVLRSMSIAERLTVLALFILVAEIIAFEVIKYKRREARKILETMVKISVFDNGSPEIVKDISVGSLQATMEHWDCTAFETEDILRAVKIETRAYGWANTSFTLIFEDGTTKHESAWHR